MKPDIIKCVIFDLDGTLLDTSRGILESVQYAIDKSGYPQLSHEQMCSFIGPPLRVSFMDLYGCSDEEAVRLTEIYRECYGGDAFLHAEPYDGIFELCDTLRKSGWRLAAATNKPAKYTEPLLKHFGFDKYIDIIQCADKDGRTKKSDLIRQCMEDASADHAVMIGDTAFDAKGAFEAGVPFIIAGYGFGNMEEMHKYPNIGSVNKPLEVYGLLEC